MSNQKLILLILDGWGLSEEKDNNAIAMSGAPNFNNLMATCPNTKLNASEEEVGLPKGQMGNSEVGHTNIGAGRIVYQDFLKITKSVESGEIEQNKKNLNEFFDKVKKRQWGCSPFRAFIRWRGTLSHRPPERLFENGEKNPA